MLEIEQKFRLIDPQALIQKLQLLGATPHPAIEQRDRYFAHPVRDFAATDEALRLRSTGPQNAITFKGPKQGSVAKTRTELEIPFAEGSQAASQFEALLVQLGFRVVRDVVKRRSAWSLTWEGWPTEVTIDEVQPLGLFAEIEILAEDSRRQEAEASILTLSQSLTLSEVEQRSYLEMLIDFT